MHGATFTGEFLSPLRETAILTLCITCNNFLIDLLISKYMLVRLDKVI